MIRAILRAQWLSMRMFRLTSREGGAVLSAITATVWYGLWTLAAWLAFEFLSLATPRQLGWGLTAGFLFMTGYWQLAPAFSGSLGASLDFRKLLIYPVPHARLFLVELGLRLMTALEMLLLLGGGTAGLLANPAVGWTALPRLAAGGALFVAFNVFLGSGLRSLLERLLSRRYVREITMLALVLLTALPRALYSPRARPGGLALWFSAFDAPAWPWAAVAHVFGGEGVLAAYGVLIAWTGVAACFGRWQFERNLRFDAIAAQATAAPSRLRRGDAWYERLYRLPRLVLGDPLAAVVEKELRSLSRTPRFRMVFVMGFTFGLLVWLPMAGGRAGHSESVLARHFLAVVSVYALTLLGQVSYWNSFGFDRSAAQFWFCAPVAISRTLAGKNIAAMLWIYLEVLAVILAMLVIRVRVPAYGVAETMAVTGVAALYMLALGNLSSVYYPRAMTPQHVRGGGSTRRFQALVFVFYPLALLPVSLAYVGRYALDSEVAFYLLLAVAAIAGGVVYSVSTQSAAHAAVRRRERIIQELAMGQGPVETE